MSEDGAGSERTLPDCRRDALVRALDHISGGKCPPIRGAQIGVDCDPSMDAEVQLVAH